MWRTAGCLQVLCLLLRLQTAGDSDHFLAIHQRMNGKPVFIYHHVQSVEKSLDTSDQKDYGHNSPFSSHAKLSKLHPAIILKSTFSRPAYEPSLNLLAMTGEDQEVENLPVPAANVITVVSVFFCFFRAFLMVFQVFKPQGLLVSHWHLGYW
ncbi:hypothetical protein lerEdw1_021009 [Lerista edwardsae]|nr:hypothetical protein lerEdw1_021009 [Lerista edwardsae]